MERKKTVIYIKSMEYIKSSIKSMEKLKDADLHSCSQGNYNTCFCVKMVLNQGGTKIL